MKHTPLFDRHLALDGRMVEFGGFELPIYYTSILDEHENVRMSCGIFDVSHLGEVRVSGPGALAYLERMVPTDVAPLGDGRILYTALLNDAGGIVDDIMIYRENAQSYVLVINAAGIAKVFGHLQSHVRGEASLQNVSDQIGCIAIQGPKAEEICAKLLGRDAVNLEFHQFQKLSGFGEGAWISRTGYTGEDGFEIFADPAGTQRAWDLFIKHGTVLGVKPVGLGARNTLRLEAGNGLYGSDMDESKIPYEVRLGWLISKAKTHYVGASALAHKRQAGVTRLLCGFRVISGGVARDHCPVKSQERVIGQVTSGSYSPSLKGGIGFALVEASFAKAGTSFQIEVHGKAVDAVVAGLPFVPLRHRRTSTAK